MKKLHELFGINPTNGDVGIEIECEGANLQPVMGNGWRTEDDNSLRGEYPNGRCEWVFAKPLSLTDALSSLEYLEDVQKKGKAKFNFSFRTSVHVHVNVQKLTVDEILNMCYTYFLCERVLMNYCAPHRRGNRFCLRMEDAEGLMATIIKLTKAEEYQWPGLNPHDRIRYSALNLEALWKYGSLEFRGLEGNMDIQRIHKWATAFVNIREFAKKFANVQEIHDLYVKNRPDTFFKMAVGDVYRVFEYEGYVNDLRRGFSLTIDIPYAYRAKEVEEKGVIKTKARFDHMIFEDAPAPGVVEIIRDGVQNINPWVVPPPQMIRAPRPAPQNRPVRPQF